MALFKGLMQRFDRMLGRGVIDDELYDELEEALILADTSLPVAESILEELRQAVRREKITDPIAMRDRLRQAITERIHQDADEGLRIAPQGVTVYLFVGVNGAGKTTSIGKLAHRLRRNGKTVLLAAGDTFRAAAIDQLEIWAERTGSEIVRTRPGADSAAVVFDAIRAAEARNIQFVLADTAGRQHTKASLMAELAKVARVVEKAHGRPPEEVLLVLDANTGQNAVRQAEEFGASAGVTGLVLTKLDGTARGGALLGVWERLKIPIKLIGTGEKPEDMKPFKAEEFAAGLFE